MRDFEVIEFGPAEAPAIGDPAPDFLRPLVNQDYWTDTALSDIVEVEPVLLVFYPMNGTGTSVHTWHEFRDRVRAGAPRVFGVSIGTPFDHQRFIHDHDLPFSLFSDPSNTVAGEYGVTHDVGGMAGIEEPRLSAFLVSTDMSIEWTWVSTQWPQSLPYDEIEAVLKEH